MKQNTQLWLLPGNCTAEYELQPGTSLEMDFVEGLDGRFRYEVWVFAAVSEETRFTAEINGEVLGNNGTLSKGEEAEWNCFGEFEVPKGEYRIQFTNHGADSVKLEGILLTRDSGYIRCGEADKHRQKLALGDSVDAFLDAQFFNGAKTPEEEAERLIKLSRMGFLEREDQMVSEGKCRCGVPLGGIGAGKVELDADGVFTAITINNNQDVPIYRADGSFLGLWYRGKEETGAWILQKENHLPEELPRVKEITYWGHFPGVDLRYEGLPLEVCVEAFSSLIPNNVQDSALPGMICNVRVRNPKTYPVEAAVLFSWENLLGTGGTMADPKLTSKETSSYIMNTWNPGFVWCDRRGNHQQEISGGLRFTGGEYAEVSSSKGEYVLLCDGEEGLTCRSAWNPETEAVSFWKDFAENGELTETAADPVQEALGHLAGALSKKISLKAGEEQVLTFALSWHLPHYVDARGEDIGVCYAEKFVGAEESARYLLAHAQELKEKTMEFEELLEQSSLPQWLKEKLLNDRFPIYTCSWFDREGRFSINEAPTGMMGCFGTMDQRLACCGMYTNLFKELDHNELSLFADMQWKDGSIPHDLGFGYIRRDACGGTWSDLCSSFILQVYKYFTYTADRDFLEEMYPRVKRAVDYQLSIDFDQNGIPDVGPGHGTTYDTYQWYGNSAFVAILWLAELKAGIKLGEQKGDAEFAEKCEQLFLRAQESVIRELWNENYDFGGYFNNYYDCSGGTKSENCFIAQLAGQWFADLMDLGDLLPADKISEALKTIYQRNIRLHDMKLMNDETTPEGDFYAYEYTFIQYDEVYYACLAIYRGMVEEGLDCFRRIYDATNHAPWNIGLTYKTDGRFEGLPYYMTNPASLFLLEALSGWVPDAVGGTIRFAPKMIDEKSLKLPLFSPSVWMQMEYQKNPEEEIYQLKVQKVLDAEFTKLKFAVSETVKEVWMGDQVIHFEQNGKEVLCTMEKPLTEGQELKIALKH